MGAINLNEYNTIIFDCDGVILDINQNKVDAFRKTVSNYSVEIQNRFADYCSNSFGISRYKKFEDFFEFFSNKPFNQKEYDWFLEQYSEICKKDYLNCPITTGTVRLLKKLQQSGFNVFIASGSDEAELRETFKNRQLDQYFIKIYGSPATKDEAIHEIFNLYEVGKALFIGDSFADLKTAKNNGIDFVYMSEYTIQSKEQHELCIQNSISHIKNLSELFSANDYI